MKKTVALRLSLKFSLLVAFIILFFSGALVLFFNRNIYNQRCKEVKDVAHTIINQVQHSTLPTSDGNIPYYITYVILKKDNANDDYTKSIATNDPFLPQLPLTSGKVIRYFEKDYYLDGALNILYYAEKIQTEQWGTIVIQTALNMDQDSSRHFLPGLIWISLFSFIPLVILSFGIVYLITKRAMQPVREITQTANKISSANLSERLPVSENKDEIDTLAQTFNNLFSRLQKDFDHEKEFTSNVSHELKTPLAVILGHANLLRRWGKDDPVQLEKSLTLLINEVHSMETIIENLLQLSHLDTGRIQLKPELISLPTICHRLEDDTKAWAPQTDFIIDESVNNCRITTDKELFYQACTIIVSNSVKFFSLIKQNKSTEKKLMLTFKAQIKYNSEQKQILFSITDNGPGIPPEVSPHIFERFYRGDSSHNRSVGGSGLGLSIVKSIMLALHGSVKAESNGKSGTTVILVFPTDWALKY